MAVSSGEYPRLSQNAAEVYDRRCAEIDVKPNSDLRNLLGAHTVDTLREINLSRSYYGPKQALVLARMLKECPAVELVNFAGNAVTFRVVEALAESLTTGIVRTVVLDGNPLNVPSGLQILAAVRKNAAIVVCSLAGTQLPAYVLDDIQTQVELNELVLSRRELAKREVRLLAPRPKCLDELNFDELSNADDCESVSTLEMNLGAQADEGGEHRSVNSPGTHCDVTVSTTEIQTIIAATMKSGTPFDDTQFPFDESRSLQPHCTWKSFASLCAERGGTTAAPTCTGVSLLAAESHVRGLEWVHGAVAVVREVESLRRLVCIRALTDIGVYVFQFRKGDRVVSVVVDDKIPVLNDGTQRVACLHHEDPCDAWAPLLVKAYAKLHRGFDNLLGGSVRYAVEDFLGGICCKSQWTLSSLRHHRDEALETLREHLVHRRLVFVKCAAVGELEKKSAAALGLCGNRYYALRNVTIVDGGSVDTKGTVAVQLTSPFRGVVWKGRLSAESAETEKFAAALGTLASQPDGRTFWMLFEDFLAFFQSVYVVYHSEALDPSVRKIATVDDPAVVTPAVPAPFGDVLWPLNPTFVLSTTAPEAQVILRVLQHDPRYHPGGSTPAGGVRCDVVPCEGDGSERRLFFNPATDDVRCSSLPSDIFGREAVILQKLHRNQPLQVTVSSSAGATPFHLVASSSGTPFSLVRFGDGAVHSATIRGSWHGLLAAGRYHDPSSVARAMQYTISLADATPASVATSGAVDVAVYLQQLSSTYKISLVGHYAAERLSSIEQVASALLADFAPTTFVALRAELSPMRPCVTVLPSTWNAGEEGEYVLVALSKVPLKIEPRPSPTKALSRPH